MTADPAPPGPIVEADLSLEVDGPAGRTTALVTGSAGGLQVWTYRPDVVLATTGRRLGSTELLDTLGTRVELHGPGGRVLSYDPRRDSGLGSLLWGSRHVVVDRAGWATLPRAAALRSRPAKRRPTAALVVGAVVTGIGLAAWLRRR